MKKLLICILYFRNLFGFQLGSYKLNNRAHIPLHLEDAELLEGKSSVLNTSATNLWSFLICNLQNIASCDTVRRNECYPNRTTKQ